MEEDSDGLEDDLMDDVPEDLVAVLVLWNVIVFFIEFKKISLVAKLAGQHTRLGPDSSARPVCPGQT